MPWRYILSCFSCNARYPATRTNYHCDKCNGLLEIRFQLSGKSVPWKTRTLGVWKYRELLPIDDDRFIISLHEGGTGLHRCQRLGREIGLGKLYVKNEGENPTASFKDRGMTAAISKARELGKKKVVCASTGNTAASLAAYSARAGLECFVFVPAGKVASGKMLQVMIHDAKIFSIQGDFDRAMEAVTELAKRRAAYYLMNSINPFRIEGQKTLAFEVCDQLNGKAPDLMVLPVGNGGNISAAWKGVSEFHELGVLQRRPRMIGIQAKKAAPIATAFRKKMDHIVSVDNPQTIATAIRIGSPVNSPKALKAIKESDGIADSVTDREILEAQRALASKEGIFVEPASAASIAGISRLRREGKIDRSDLVVCVTTGHGLKDPSIADRLRHVKSYTLKITGHNWITRLEQLT